MKELILGDCLEALRRMPANSIDSLVTDPPAGISFMGREWDKSDGFIPFITETMTEVLRVLKPGAHGLVWAIPRTSHWTATALENAGFEIRDVVTHLFGSGFPKSLDISKAIDRAAGAEREVIGINPSSRPNSKMKGSKGFDGDLDSEESAGVQSITAPATPDAKLWQGFGTALKPASEHWILVRKPLSEKTVAANVLKWGCGGLNIDRCRIEGSPRTTHKDGNIKGKQEEGSNSFGAGLKDGHFTDAPNGRFPANLVLSHNEDCVDGKCSEGCSVAMLDEQSEINASRFFYCAKASKSERNRGCEGNVHPTIKPIRLMSYLIRLITPPHGVVLDPFMGSGSTGVSAIQEGFKFIGIEREKEYFEISKARIHNL